MRIIKEDSPHMDSLMSSEIMKIYDIADNTKNADNTKIADNTKNADNDKFGESTVSRCSLLSFADMLKTNVENISSPMLFAEDFSVGSPTSLLSCHEPSVVRTPYAVFNAASSYVTTTVKSLVSNFGLFGATRRFADDHVMGLIDSGANVHILSYEAATELLRNAI